ERRWRAVGQDHVGRHADQLSRLLVQAIAVSRPPAVFRVQVASLQPSEIPHPFIERFKAQLCVRIRYGKAPAYTDAAHPFTTLCQRRERPRRRRATDQRYDLTAFQLTRLHPQPLAGLTAYRTSAHQSGVQRLAALQDFNPADVRFGSKADLSPPLEPGPLYPQSGHKRARVDMSALCQKRTLRSPIAEITKLQVSAAPRPAGAR